MTLVEALFGLLGLVALGSGLLVVTTRQLVHAALWLVVCLGAVAGCYLLLSAELVAWVQVLIYVGAVVVLLLFGLMLTRAPIGVSADLDAPPVQRLAAAVVALGLAAIVVLSSVDAFRGEYIELSSDDVGGSSAGTRPIPSWRRCAGNVGRPHWPASASRCWSHSRSGGRSPGSTRST